MYDLYDIIGAGLLGVAIGMMVILAMNTWPKR